MTEKNITLVEDDGTLRLAIRSFLERLDYSVQAFESVEEATKHINPSTDLILSDIMMAGLSGFDLLKFTIKKYPHIPVILMTAFGSIEKAVEAMKVGAYDFLVKPFSLSVLETSINAAFLDRKPPFSKDLENPSQEAHVASHIRISERFLTNNPRMLEMIENTKKIATSKATVLIQGESGTGKEFVAHMIHEFSPRKDRIFVAINCAAMPDTLLESELFGHEKGAFTGAVARQVGKFELSNNGTILLDEISEMSLAMQTKLLRVLQECEIYRVGGIKPIPLNLRVIATTNRDLYEYMKTGHFREDLFYRLNVIPIIVPPLRERGEDTLFLSQKFLDEFATLHARKNLKIDENIKKKISSYAWPGNVRELRNTMERAILVGDFNVIDENQALSNNIQEASSQKSTFPFTNMTLGAIEKIVIIQTLQECNGNKTKTASKLGISLRTLRNKLKSYDSASPYLDAETDGL
ncbi:MAG: hypothetical protein A3G32_08185 [Deltaproteobacteria bacterium RIFCSPLOWO2_12_FULL_40_28]|nr:MAG: hypothetical protein A3C45_00885 [Deltaproteobacteria bacterium RIFCSPHIGHO2_02_FULL_40_28]OGQ20888.1 MAG: hypothetical protein A3E27_03550 [Deltaproteobacteria bacterium RIFCSPHIGHO2_12_FULL_40_32]OGQ39289.1 MAG: hypothetical protein A3I69_04910 [Deltaproteobacteria bacterium RIFCSPLOWO2_02_FULL_40_36]OGQ54570.1 MAG: hypothetical protein A3G32_08185 [Deltaproteobacteria bacterium RIFCSPLOWO2_12_FULL_40_28]